MSDSKTPNVDQIEYEIAGMEWYNSLTREQRKYWLEQTEDYVPETAYKKYLESQQANSQANQYPVTMSHPVSCNGVIPWLGNQPQVPLNIYQVSCQPHFSCQLWSTDQI